MEINGTLLSPSEQPPIQDCALRINSYPQSRKKNSSYRHGQEDIISKELMIYCPAFRASVERKEEMEGDGKDELRGSGCGKKGNTIKDDKNRALLWRKVYI